MILLRSDMRDICSRPMISKVFGMAFLLLLDHASFSQNPSGAQTEGSWQKSHVFTSLEEAVQARNQGIPIYRLDLSKKRLKECPPAIATWSEIRELNLSQNKIAELDLDLCALVHLEKFSAASNRLSHFPGSVLSWNQLTELDLGDNYIDSIPMDIDALSELKKLTLWSNVIGYYPASLGDLPKLEWLDLQLNDMTLEEQEALKSWLPNRVDLNLSPPCRCVFDE